MRICIVKVGSRVNRPVLTGVNKFSFRHVPVYRMTFESKGRLGKVCVPRLVQNELLN